jgi:hypothetical protein
MRWSESDSEESHGDEVICRQRCSSSGQPPSGVLCEPNPSKPAAVNFWSIDAVVGHDDIFLEEKRYMLAKSSKLNLVAGSALVVFHSCNCVSTKAKPPDHTTVVLVAKLPSLVVYLAS